MHAFLVLVHCSHSCSYPTMPDAAYETVGLASSSEEDFNDKEEKSESKSLGNIDAEDFVDNDSIPEEFLEEESRIHRRTCLLRVLFFMMLQTMVVALALLFLLQPSSSWIPFRDNNDQMIASAGHSQEYMTLKASSTLENIENGAVASDHEICSDVGVKILRDFGGNAVDSAVATALCLGVVNPTSSGIGGGAFILIHADMTSHQSKIQSDDYVSPSFIDARDPVEDDEQSERPDDKVTEVIDCRETAPAAAQTNMFRGKPATASTEGGLAIAVPGELRGLELAHNRHGLLPWAVVVEPSLNLAKNGVPVGPHLAADIPKYWNTTDGLRYILTRHNDGKTMLEEGDTMTQPQLARTLQAIQEKGANAVYTGFQASQLARDIQKAGGIITIHDLHNYKPTLRTPLIAEDVHGYTLVGVGPPSSGGATMIGAARFLVGYKERRSEFGSALSKHRMVEAMRHAFAIRMSLSDPLYNKDTTDSAIRALVQGKHMEALRSFTMDNSTLPLSRYGGRFSKLRDNQAGVKIRPTRGDRWLENHGTSHISVVDKEGNAVAISSSLNTIFGSRVVSESTGILLNNQMDDFAIPGRPNYHGVQPSEENYIKPRKKPLSSMSPTLVFRHEKDSTSDLGEFFMALGASGGPKIITSVLQTFLNYARGGMSLFDAITFPRLHDQLLYHESATTLFEKTNVSSVDYRLEVPEVIKRGLKTRGHRLDAVGYTGCVQAVAMDRKSGKLVAVSDIRKGGKPAGY